MVDHKDIETALLDVIRVAYRQGTKKYDKMGVSYINYLKTLRQKRDPDDHVRYVAKQRAPNEEMYNERMADFKDWYNEAVYTSLEKLYKLYLELANQEEKLEERTDEEINAIFRINGLEID